MSTVRQIEERTQARSDKTCALKQWMMQELLAGRIRLI